VAKWFIALVGLWLMPFDALAQSQDLSVELPIARPDYSASPKPLPPKPATQIYQAACPVVLDGRAVGKIMAPLAENGCGTQSPFRITAIRTPDRTIKLSSAIKVNCSMATALVEWVSALDRQVEAASKSTLSKINVGTSYTCRRRNNQESGKISEHGFANALDLTGFELGNGKTVALPSAWNTEGVAQELIKSAHKLACTHFTTVLGPQANALHQDHLHLDMGCHGKSCTYRVCD